MGLIIIDMELVTRRTHKSKKCYHLIAEADKKDHGVPPPPLDSSSDSLGSGVNQMFFPPPQEYVDSLWKDEGEKITTPYLEETASTMINMEFAYLGLFLLMMSIALAGQTGFLNLDMTGSLYNWKSIGFVTFIMVIACLLPAMCCFKRSEGYERERDHRNNMDDMGNWKFPDDEQYEQYFHDHYDYQTEDGGYDQMINAMGGLMVFPVLCILCPMIMITCESFVQKCFGKLCGSMVGDYAKDKIAPNKQNKSLITQGMGFVKDIGDLVGSALEDDVDDKPKPSMYDPFSPRPKTAKPAPYYNKPPPPPKTIDVPDYIDSDEDENDYKNPIQPIYENPITFTRTNEKETQSTESN